MNMEELLTESDKHGKEAHLEYDQKEKRFQT